MTSGMQYAFASQRTQSEEAYNSLAARKEVVAQARKHPIKFVFWPANGDRPLFAAATTQIPFCLKDLKGIAVAFKLGDDVNTAVQLYDREFERWETIILEDPVQPRPGDQVLLAAFGVEDCPGLDAQLGLAALSVIKRKRARSISPEITQSTSSRHKPPPPFIRRTLGKTTLEYDLTGATQPLKGKGIAQWPYAHYNDNHYASKRTLLGTESSTTVQSRFEENFSWPGKFPRTTFYAHSDLFIFRRGTMFTKPWYTEDLIAKEKEIKKRYKSYGRTEDGLYTKWQAEVRELRATAEAKWTRSEEIRRARMHKGKGKASAVKREDSEDESGVKVKQELDEDRDEDEEHEAKSIGSGDIIDLTVDSDVEILD